ncbi:nucleoid-associated protein [Azospirillum sp. sgz302134]
MNFANLTLNRVIVHEVFKRDDDRNPRTPRYATGLAQLTQTARDALCARITKVLGSESRSIEMQIVNIGAGTCVQVVHDLLGCADDGAFVTQSCTAADNLAHAQQTRAIPGGILVIFEGQADHPAKRVLGFIKAEPQNGFNINFDFLENLFLTPAARMYKVGVFVEENPGAVDHRQRFKAFVYDDLMTVTNRQSAALYFYESFLGFGFAATSARLTREFFDYTKEFINGLSMAEEEKSDLHTGLYTYLKVDQSPNVEVNTFALTYLPDPRTRDDYLRFMAGRQFPQAAVRKDVSDVAKLLVNRRVRFKSNIRLIVPADKYERLVHIETIDPDGADGAANDGNRGQWTRVTIRDVISDLT